MQHKNDKKILSDILLVLVMILCIGCSWIIAAPVGAMQIDADERAWLEAHGKIVVGGEMDWAPFDFVDENGKYAGIANDYLRIIGEKLGIEIEMVTGPSWDELLSMMRRKEIDVLPAIYHSEDRESFVHFTSPYIKITEFIFSSTENQTISSLPDLKDKTTVVVKGYTIEGYLRSHYPDYNLVTAPTIADALKKIVTGEADAFIGDIISTSYNLKELSLVNIRPVAPVLFEGPKVHMAVRKDWPILRDLINKTLKAIPDGDHDAIKSRWISFAEKKIQHSRPEITLTAEEQAWVTQHPVVRVHNETDWPPFNYFEYGSPRGLSIDYMNLVAKKLGIRAKYITGPSWNEFLGLIKRKELDVMLNIVKTEDRMKYLLYTDPYIKNPNSIVSSQKNPYETIESLFGKTVAFPKGFFYEEVLTKSFPQIKRLPVEDTLASLKAVTFGRADAALGEEAVFRTLINKNFLSGLRISGEVNIGDPDLANLRLGVRDDWPLLQSALMKAMAAVTLEEMAQIRQKWLTVRDQTIPRKAAVRVSYQRLIIYGVAVFIILCLLAWILFKIIKKDQIAVNFGSPWFRGLVLAGLSVFVLIVLFLGWYMLERNRAEQLVSVDETLRGIISVSEDRFDLWLKERTSYVARLGRDPNLVAITKRLLQVRPDKKALLASGALIEARFFFQNTADIFHNMGFFLINPDHVSIGSMRNANLGTRNLISKQNPKLLQQAFQGKVGFVPPMTSDVGLGDSSKSDKDKKPPTMFFIGPVQDTDGRILAVMTLRVDPWKDFARSLKSFRGKASGESYAFDRNGVMLSSSQFEDQLRRIGLLTEDQTSALNIEIRDPGGNMVRGYRPDIPRSQQPLTQLVLRTLALRQQMEETGVARGHSPVESDVEGYRDYRGVPVFGAWLWNADLGIGLAVEVDEDEALSHYYRTRLTIFSILGFTLVLSVGAILFVLIIGERTSRALMRARDDLEDKVAERTEQLTVAEERSRLLLDSAGEGIFGVDADGKLAFINPAASRMLGYEPDELIGEGIHAKIHYSHIDGTDYPKEACPMYRSYTEGTDYHINDEVLWRKDGSSFSVEYTCMPLKKDGRVVGAVVTFMDISERKKMETELLAERERLQKILDTSPVGVGISTEGVVRFANPRFAELFYRGKGDAAQEAYVNPEDREYIMKELEKSGVVSDYELQTYGRNREIRDTLATFIRTEYEGQTSILSWMVDLSGLKEAERELKTKFDELDRFRRMAIGREQKMIELKKEINELLKENGLSEKYKIH